MIPRSPRNNADSPGPTAASAPASRGNALLRRFAQLFLPGAALIVLGALLIGESAGRSKLQQLRTRLAVEVGRSADVPADRVQGIVDGLHLVARAPAMRELLDDSDAQAPRRAAELFVALLTTSARLDQVRWIDETGQERVRAERRGDIAVLVPQGDLQDKRDRYYFIEASRLLPGALYLSPLDLNIERGQLERPYKPMLRAATPVADSDGRARGIVIVNYRAQDLLDRVLRMLNDAPGEVQLLDSDGNWLHHPDPSRAWGFMLGRAESLRDQDAQLWSTLTHDEHGQRDFAGALWTWAWVRWDALTASRDAPEAAAPRLLVAVRTAPAQLAAVRGEAAPLVAAAAAALLLLYALLAWRLARAGLERDAMDERAARLQSVAEAERELRRSEAQRHQVEQSLLDEQRRFREAAEASGRAWRQLAESMPHFVWTCTADGRCDYLSKQWLEYTGVAEAPQLGFGWLDQVHVDDRPALTAAWARAVQALDVFDVEFRIRRHDGVYRWFKTRAVPLLDDAGRITRWYGSNTDIDDLKNSERALRVSEQRFRTIYDATPVSIWEEDWSAVIADVRALSAQGVTDFAAYCREHPEHTTRMLRAVKILDVNQRTLELFRAPDKAAMLASLETVFATDDTLPGFIAEVSALADGKTRFSTQMAVNTLDGQRISVLLAMSLPPAGSASGIVFVSVIDVTEQQRISAELALHRHHLEELVERRTHELREANLALAGVRDRLIESEARFRSAFEAAAIGMALVGLDGRFVQVNPALCQLLGYGEAELKDLTFQDITHPDDLKADLAYVRELVAKQRRSYQMEKRYFRKDGSVVWILLTGSTVENAAGELRYFVAQIQDISARRLAEQALQEREKFLRTITDALPGMVGYWDADLRCRFANAAYRIWFDRSPEELDGMSMQTLLGPELFRVNEPYIRGVLQGRPQRFERTLVKADGTTGYTWAHYIPDIDHEQVRGFFVLVTDVTELKQAQIALQETNVALIERSRQAEAANQAKSRFVATMSHEIRTPMNAVLGLVQLLGETPLDTRQQDYVQKIRSASRALLNILNDILDYSKIEAGRLALEEVEFDIDHVLENVGDLFSVAAEEKGLELFMRITERVPRRLSGDPLRLGQILNNLVGNAIKFTERGEIGIAVDCVPGNDGEVTLEFVVTDTGIGLSDEQCAHLFQPFVQGDSSTTRRFGGSGLGLAICKGLVEIMHGTISVDSHPGGGSRFGFTARLRRAAPSAERPAGLKLENRRVLVVDSRPTSRRILADLLSPRAMKVACVGTGAEALAQLEAAARDRRPYQIALIGNRLPDQGGTALVGQVRRMIASGDLPRLHLVLMAADIQPLTAGAGPDETRPDAWLVKPVTPSRIFDVLADLEGHARMSRCATRVAPIRELRERVASIAGARVLLVEDNPINQQVAEELLKGFGLQVDVANGGRVAVERAAATRYDLVLMDLQMPDMDGLEATRQIRARERRHRVPIIAMTAAAMSEDRDAARAAGMDDHLSKPIDIERLVGVLQRWIPERTIAPAVLPAPLPAEAGPAIPPIDGIDVQQALTRLGGNAALLRRLLRQFADGYGEAALPLQTSLDRGDRATAARMLHSLRGTAGSIGAMQVHAAAAALETALAAGSTVDLGDLRAAIARACSAIALQVDDAVPVASATPPPLRAQLEHIRALLERHRAVPGETIAAVLQACIAAQRRAEGERLAHALETFDYAQARARIAELLQVQP